jgi:hypothetical protein
MCWPLSTEVWNIQGVQVDDNLPDLQWQRSAYNSIAPSEDSR